MGVKNIYERFLWFDRKAGAGAYPNASKLAEKFEISAKTAQRDIEFMRDRLNCPLLYDQRMKGYYYEDKTYSLPSIYISAEELSALLMARNILQGISAEYLEGEVSQVVGKITAILKRHTVNQDIIDNAVSVRHIEYVRPPREIFQSVLEGCLTRRSIHFSYYSPATDERTSRQVDPYHVFNYMGNWHLVGHCHLRRHLRDFNLARMSDVKVLDDTFSLRDNFRPEDYFGFAFGLYKSASRMTVTLRFTPEKTKRIAGQIWHREQEVIILPDGSMELSFPVTDFSEVVMEVLKHGSGVEVLQPEDLRDLIKTEVAKLAQIY
jgi:predicted DNA-binding transcriptional regulator YafY